MRLRPHLLILRQHGAVGFEHQMGLKPLDARLSGALYQQPAHEDVDAAPPVIGMYGAQHEVELFGAAGSLQDVQDAHG